MKSFPPYQAQCLSKTTLIKQIPLRIKCLRNPQDAREQSIASEEF